MDPIALAVMDYDEVEILPMLSISDQNIFMGIRYNTTPNRT